MRHALIRLGARQHQFVWTFHHLIMDGWSSSMLVGEVARLYEAYAQGQAPEAERGPSYRAYMKWLSRQDLKQAERYWRERLAGISAPTPLGLERGRGAATRAAGARPQRLSATINEEQTEKLQSCARRQQVTLNTVVQGAWAILLSRYSGREEVVYGVTVSGRPAALAGVEQMVGMFINTLPVRVKVDGQARVDEWLRELQREQVEMREYEYSPLVQVQGWSEVPKGVPCSTASWCLRTTRWIERCGSGKGGVYGSVGCGPLRPTTIRWQWSWCPAGKCNCNCCMTSGRLRSRAWRGCWRRCRDCSRRLASLKASGWETWKSSLRKSSKSYFMNGMTSPEIMPNERCLHELFEERVEKAPHAVALVYEEQTVTYQALNQRANQLAHYLKKLGVGLETTVGLCIERSIEMVVGILGVLKAGGSYLPLDPDYPAERLAFIMQDSQCYLVVTQESLTDHLPDDSVRLICLDTEWAKIAEERTANCVGNDVPESTAYVIYTSGSTGNPKGVLVSHNHATRLFRSTEQWYHFNESDVWTLFHSYAFDFSVWELWGALLYGGRLVIVPYWVSRSPEVFYKLLCRESVTVLNQTPSAFYQLIRAEEAVGVSNEMALRYVIFGGEALEIQSLKPWFDRHGCESPELVNMYGITETTVHVTYRPITPQDVIDVAGSVIGVPLPDLQVYLLGEDLKLAPIGVIGELYVGGDGVSRGYLNRPELTTERFIPNPYSKKPGTRLYRSGDLARYLSNGDLEYFGRVDHQVKIRGFRIELGEIETTLVQRPAVFESVAIARQEERGEKRIVAYVVPDKASVLSVEELRQYLAERLPEYMVPSAIVVLERLPLTGSGKVDRGALPEPGAAGLGVGGSYVAARSQREAELCRIWSEVLGAEQVGIHDNFFELGGDSILSLQVIAQAARAGLKLTPKQVFEHPTVAELAGLAGVSQEIVAGSAAAQAEESGAVELTPIQARFFRAQPDAALSHYNQALLLEVSEPLAEGLLAETLRELVRHHDALRMRYERDEAGGWRQLNEPLSAVWGREWLHIIDLSEVGEEEQRAVIEETAGQLQGSLSVVAGRLLRAALLRTSGHSRLLVVIHHLVVDGVSWRVLLEDLQSVYEQLAAGVAVRLPAKTTSYRQWAAALAEYASSEVVSEQAEYWLEQAEAAVMRLAAD